MKDNDIIGIYACIKNDPYVLENLIHYCSENNINDYYIYVDKVSHRKDIKNRKALEQLKRDVKKNKVNKVIFSNLDGISINMDYNINLLKYLNKYNCKFISADGRSHEDLILIMNLYDLFPEISLSEIKKQQVIKSNKKNIEIEREER